MMIRLFSQFGIRKLLHRIWNTILWSSNDIIMSHFIIYFSLWNASSFMFKTVRIRRGKFKVNTHFPHNVWFIVLKIVIFHHFLLSRIYEISITMVLKSIVTFSMKNNIGIRRNFSYNTASNAKIHIRRMENTYHSNDLYKSSFVIGEPATVILRWLTSPGNEKNLVDDDPQQPHRPHRNIK